ncbi:MAG: serine hydrolase [Gammaproteobacteria bacterium]
MKALIFSTLLLFAGMLGAADAPPIGNRMQVLQPEYQLGSYTHMQQVYPSRIISRGGPVRELPASRQPLTDVSYEYDGKRYKLEDYLKRVDVTGLLVLKDGKVAYETYRQGTGHYTRFVSWSMAKSFVSTLFGLALEDGLIKSVNDPVTQYVPELKDSAYKDNSLRDLLQMSSGVKFDEDYTGESRSLSVKAWIEGVAEQKIPYNQTILWFKERINPPGTHFYYASIEPQVVGWAVSRATGKHLADLLSERIWQHLGAENDATWILDRTGGMEIASCCISATLRDFGRFGLMFANGGRVGDQQLIPAEWIKVATRPDPQREFLHPGHLSDGRAYGYQNYWWLWPGEEGAFSALGYGGQEIYINPKRNIVIVRTATWPEENVEALLRESMAFEQAVVNALH